MRAGLHFVFGEVYFLALWLCGLSSSRRFVFRNDEHGRQEKRNKKSWGKDKKMMPPQMQWNVQYAKCPCFAASCNLVKAQFQL